MSPSTSTTTSPLLARHGAVEGEGADAGVASHYGDPVREQRLLAEGLAAVDLSHRGVVTITGPDRLSWLHSMTSQHLLGLEPRTSRESLVLSPKGHVEHALHLVDDGETAWITVEPGTAPALVGWLESMRFMLRVEVADVSADWAVLGEPLGAESVPGEPLAWVDPWPGPGRRHRGLRAGRGPPGSGPRLARADRAPGRARGGGRRPPAGRHLGRRGAAGRRVAAAAGLRDRPPHHRRTRSTGCAPPCTCTRAATAARRPSPGCTTWAGHRGGWCSCTSTGRGTCCRRPVRRCCSGSARWAGSPRWPGTTRTARWRWRWSSARWPTDVDLVVDGISAAQTVVVSG